MAGKRIVICADGTWNSPFRSDGSDPSLTNVLKMSQAVRPVAQDGRTQVVYYHTGVGTGWNWVDRMLGGGAGLGISKNIVDAYLFLVTNYAPGDQIFLFGFSRGAYTVRSLAGFIRNCGILRREHASRVQEAYGHYRSGDSAWHPDSGAARAYRETYAWRETPSAGDPRGEDSTIHFIGVWDTVGALGVPGGFFRLLTQRWYAFHDTQLSRYIDHAYHALAIDERRAPFYPTLWDPESTRLRNQTLEQTWFAGVHSNVGGGYPDTGLSDLTFAWMAERAAKHGLDLDCNTPCVAPNPKEGTLYDSQRIGFRFLGILGKLRNLTSSVATGASELQTRIDGEIARRTRWSGDCVRAIPPQTGIHPSVAERRAVRRDYSPPNVPPPNTAEHPHSGG